MSDFTDNKGGRLSEEEKNFFDTLPPAFVFSETMEPFDGTVKTIVYDDPIRYYDSLGRELLPVYYEILEPKKDFLKG